MLGLACVTSAARTVYIAEWLHCFHIRRPTRLTMLPGERLAMQGWHSINLPAGAIGGGGAHKQRWIPVIKSARPTTPTKPPWVPRGRSGVKDTNLIYVQTNKWELPTVINTNIRCALASKLDEIKGTKDDFGADVLTSNIPDGSLTLSGFNIYRRYRQVGRQHGGIACYVRNTIPTKHWTEVNQPNLETLWLTIRPPKMPRHHPQITICTVYHPPGSDDWTMLNHIDHGLHTPAPSVYRYHLNRQLQGFSFET